MTWGFALVRLAIIGCSCPPLFFAPTRSLAVDPVGRWDSRDASWSPDGGKVVFASNRSGQFEIHVINAEGGHRKQLTHGKDPAYYPHFSPDGRKVLYMTYTEERVAIWVMTSDGADGKRLAGTGAFNADARWSPDGEHIVFHSKRDETDDVYLMSADGRDIKRLTLDARQNNTPSFSPDGSKILFVSKRTGNRELFVMDRDGSHQYNVSRAHTLGCLVPSFSPDGLKIVFYAVDSIRAEAPRETAMPARAFTEIFVMDSDGGNRVRLTTNEHRDMGPAWTPDGKRISFASNRSGNLDIYVMDADGTNVRRLTYGDRK